jgi:hypothetical protein
MCISPVVVDATVEFGILSEAGVCKTCATSATQKAALVIVCVGHSHDVAVADAALTRSAFAGQLQTVLHHRNAPLQNRQYFCLLKNTR